MHPQDNFHGCQIVHWDHRNEKKIVLKDKLILHYEKKKKKKKKKKKNRMVSMAIVNVILKHGGVHTKLLMFQLLLILDH